MSSASTVDGTVGKAMQVLRQIAEFERPVRFKEIQNISALPKATLYRIMQTLTNQGMLSHDNLSNQYSLGSQLLRLAHIAWRQYSLAPIASPHIDELSQKIGKTIHLAQLDHGQVLYIYKRNAKNPIEMYSQAGKVSPAYCTGIGKAMLAYLKPNKLEVILKKQSFHRYTDKTITNISDLIKELKKVNNQGYAYDNEEHEEHIICIAVPIISRYEEIIGGISLTSTTFRSKLKGLNKYIPDLKEVAAKISEEASIRQFPDH